MSLSSAVRIPNKLLAWPYRVRVPVEASAFLSSKTFIPAQRSTHAPILWVQGFLLGGKEATYLHLVPRLRMSGLYLYSPYTPSWHEEAKLYVNPFRLVRYSYVHAFNVLLSNTPYPLSVENKTD
jgi:hypothetical protein